jgi:tungstate transport system ATP-binding protein
MDLRLSISDIVKSYDGKEVLSGCSYTFEKGVCSIMGPNGSGKSTLLRICALLEQPDRGNVRYFSGNETILKDDISLRRRITLVLPKPAILNTTVFRNAAYGLKVRGLDNDETGERVHGILKTVGLFEKKDHMALTISSGEAQRLALARAMVIGPEVIFIDEPTSFVDEENRKTIEGIILEMKQRGKPTVIIATHDRAQAERLSDRILFIENGTLKTI